MPKRCSSPVPIIIPVWAMHVYGGDRDSPTGPIRSHEAYRSVYPRGKLRFEQQHVQFVVCTTELGQVLCAHHIYDSTYLCHKLSYSLQPTGTCTGAKTRKNDVVNMNMHSIHCYSLLAE